MNKYIKHMQSITKIVSLKNWAESKSGNGQPAICYLKQPQASNQLSMWMKHALVIDHKLFGL